MGKIYEGENKLNILQVCDKLGKEITPAQAKALAKWYDHADTESTNKSKFAHMVLDGYKEMPSDTDHDMMVKKLAKHLMEKYMKSMSVMDGEESAFKALIENIVSKEQ